jgi:hypothetical protein
MPSERADTSIQRVRIMDYLLEDEARPFRFDENFNYVIAPALPRSR